MISRSYGECNFVEILATGTVTNFTAHIVCPDLRFSRDYYTATRDSASRKIYRNLYLAMDYVEIDRDILGPNHCYEGVMAF